MEIKSKLELEAELEKLSTTCIDELIEVREKLEQEKTDRLAWAKLTAGFLDTQGDEIERLKKEVNSNQIETLHFGWNWQIWTKESYPGPHWEFWMKCCPRCWAGPLTGPDEAIEYCRACSLKGVR